jgi:hypothetical protein
LGISTVRVAKQTSVIVDVLRRRRREWEGGGRRTMLVPQSSVTTSHHTTPPRCCALFSLASSPLQAAWPRLWPRSCCRASRSSLCDARRLRSRVTSTATSSSSCECARTCARSPLLLVLAWPHTHAQVHAAASRLGVATHARVHARRCLSVATHAHAHALNCSGQAAACRPAQDRCGLLTRGHA